MNIKENHKNYVTVNGEQHRRTKKLNSENVLRENGWNAFVVNVEELLNGLTVERFINETDKQFYEATIMDGELLAVERI